MDTDNKPVTNEIATTRDGRDITRGVAFSNALVSQDSVLASHSGDLKIYEQILSDDQVKAVWTQRQLLLQAAEWVVMPGDESARAKEAAEELKQQLRAIQWDRVSGLMQYGVFFGFAVSEIMWRLEKNKVAIEAIKPRNPRRFVFDADYQLRLKTQSNLQGEILPDKKFWQFNAGAFHADAPYGLGLGHWLYWPVFFKRAGIEAWMEFMERYATGLTVAKYPHGTDEEHQKKLAEACAAIRRDKAIIIPEGVMIEFVEMRRRGTDDYATLLDRMNAAISKVIVGQTMTADDGSSLSQAKVHEDVLGLVVKADADLIDASFNAGPVAWWMDWNYGPGVTPAMVYRRFEKEEAAKDAAETAKVIYDMGFAPSPEWINERFEGSWVKRDMSTGEPFKFSEKDTPADPAGGIADDGEVASDEAMTEMIEQIKAVLDGTESLEEAQAALLTIYKDQDPAKLAEVLGQTMALADLQGRDDG